MFVINEQHQDSVEAFSMLDWSRNGFRPVRDTKLTFRLDDESVIQAAAFELETRDGDIETHLCISSQAGCKFGCEFCVSGKNGFTRNLYSNEIIQQVVSLLKIVKRQSADHVVFMGIGEPLDNYVNVVVSIKELTDLGLTKEVSLATIGVPHLLLRLSEESFRFKAVWLSLHAAMDDKRRLIMPISRKYSIKQLIDAAEQYVKVTGTRIWVNYMLLGNFNDGMEDLDQLQKLFNGKGSLFKLFITLPNGDVSQYSAPSQAEMVWFRDQLRNRLPNVRVENFIAAGKDVNAGCGEFVFVPPK